MARAVRTKRRSRTKARKHEKKADSVPSSPQHQVSKKTHSRPFTETINHFIFHSHFSHVARGQVSRPGLKLFERESEIEMHLANVGVLKGIGTHTPCMGNLGGSLWIAL